MRYLLCFAIIPDLVGVVDELAEEEKTLNSVLSILFFVIFVFMVTLTLLNMLVGVLCEVIRVVSQVETEKVEICHMKVGLHKLIMQADEDGTGCISLKEFVLFLQNPEAARFLDSVGIDALALVDFAQTYFKKGQTYDFADIIQLLLELRSHNTCTVKDIVELRKWMDHEFEFLWSALFGGSAEEMDSMLWGEQLTTNKSVMGASQMFGQSDNKQSVNAFFFSPNTSSTNGAFGGALTTQRTTARDGAVNAQQRATMS
jgi:hypothetical protein